MIIIVQRSLGFWGIDNYFQSRETKIEWMNKLGLPVLN